MALADLLLERSCRFSHHSDLIGHIDMWDFGGRALVGDLIQGQADLVQRASDVAQNIKRGCKSEDEDEHAQSHNFPDSRSDGGVQIIDVHAFRDHDQ